MPPIRFFLLVSIGGTLSVSCDRSDQPSPEAENASLIEATPFATRPSPGPTHFAELGAAETGLDFTSAIDDSHPLRYLYASSMSTGGVAIADVDGDGHPDIFLAGGPGTNKLFRQASRMKFSDTTEAAGVGGGDAWAVGCAFADIDNDGDSDLYVCNYLSPNQLFINDGSGVFTESAPAYGIDFIDASHTPSFCDYDGDGDLDLYVMTNRWYRPEGFPREKTIEVGPAGPRVLKKFERFYDARQTGPTDWETRVVGRPDLLCRNDGSGKFTVVNEEAGISHRGHGLSATWWDWNGDGFTDLWVGNDFDDEDCLYMNLGDGTFRDITLQAVRHTTWFSMGADFGDMNDDALPDYLIADMAGSTHFKQKTTMGDMNQFAWFMDNADPPQIMKNGLFLNAGNGRFLEGASLAGLASTDWTWAVRLCDFDHDTRNDAFFQCGMSRNFNEKDDPELRGKNPSLSQWERYRHLPPLREKNRAFRNLGDMKFEDVSAAWGIDHLGMSYGCAVGDLDNDGALDIVSVRLDEPAVIFHNTAAGGGNSITFEFRGTRSNVQGIGVEARLFATATDSTPQVRTLTLSRGYLGSDEPLLHFGLGSAEVVARVELLWPAGTVQVIEGLSAGNRYTITEAPTEGALWASPRDAVGGPLYSPAPQLAAAVHRETSFDDFAREPLLPNKLSQLGPGQAWADVNGDGMPDLYLGAAKGAPRQLYLRQKDGSLGPRPLLTADPTADIIHEDMGALFFDADGDGDNDLYVVSGGVECAENSPELQDRLYYNDGAANFTRSPLSAIPAIRASGSCISAADFDRDGDLDLFVGARTRPGRYPLADSSQLLENDGTGNFSDATSLLAGPAPGIVTGAVWTDVDADGWIDLALSREWGPVAIYRNNQGTLEPLPQPGGEEKTSGWWNGITSGDLDGDGDFDLVATNFGLNTKYHASPEKPALLYYGDVDGDGGQHIIEAEYEGDTLYPVRGKSCSTAAIPGLSKKFSTYKAFAAASLPEIYPPQKLEKVRRFAATELNTCVFWNDGQGRFTPEPLPWAAQIAPSFGVIIRDIDADGANDIVLSQNFFTPQRETGRMGGGLSLLLLGETLDGKTTFSPVWPHASGIDVPGDSKSLAAVDLNGDRIPDISFGINNAPVRGFLRAPSARRPSLTLRLEGDAQNPTGVGAVVTVDDKTRAEIHAGDGYLSQSPPVLSFALATESPTVSIRWPDGSEQVFENVPTGADVTTLKKARRSPAGALAPAEDPKSAP